MSNGEDFMSLLPEEVSSYILSCLDGETLLACAAVSESWDQMTNRVDPRIFIEACWDAGISVEENKYEYAREWKVFLSSMLRRLRHIRTSACYQRFHGTIGEPVRALYCRNEKIAAAFRGAVEILDTSNTDYYMEFACDFDPSLLKFDDNMIVAASRTGYISSWSTTSGNHLGDYIVPDSTLFCFDFLTDYSLLVSGILNDSSSSIYVWSMERYDRFRKINVAGMIIYRVILVPDPSFVEMEKSCFLFGLSEMCVLAWRVHLISRSLFIISKYSYTIFPDLRTYRDVTNLTTFGFLFDGYELYFTKPFPRRSRSIRVWNFRENTERRLESCGPILSLLGVGEKYLAYNVRCPDFDAIIAVDKRSNERIATVRTPRITNDVHISLGHTSWLDGFNGENDSGIVYVSITNDTSEVAIVEFVPRSE